MAEEIDGKKVVADFAQRNGSHPNLKFLSEEGLVIEAMTRSGNFNYIYKVTSSDRQHSVIIKHGQETCRTMKFLVIPMERQDLDFNATQLYHSILPGSVPEPYCFDKYLQTMAMEDLSHMELLGDKLAEMTDWSELARMMGETLSKVHQETSKNFVPAAKWEELVSKFRCRAPVEWFIEFKFINNFQEDHSQNRFVEGCRETYRECVTSLQSVHIEKLLIDTFKREECLIHSDLHKHSLFVSQDRVAIFDFEFAVLGNPAYDFSHIICDFFNIMQDLILDINMEKREEEKEIWKGKTRKVVHIFIDSYLGERKGKLTSNESKMVFLQESALFLGYSIFVLCIITQLMPPKSAEARNTMARIGTHLMKNYQRFKTWDEIIDNILSWF